MKKITLNNIKQYIEGNINSLRLQLGNLPSHIEEQISYRRLICANDCMIQRKCIKCGCEFYGKTAVTKSCNPDRFPDLMEEQDWIKFKEQNGIT